MVLQFHDVMDAQANLISLIRALPVFAPLDEDRIADFIENGQQLCMAAGETLVSQGDASDCTFILLAGEAEVFVERSFGPVMLAPLSAGHFFGEIGALAGIPRTATVRARSAVRVLRIERDAILE